MEEFRGKVVLVVNTATGCGFTPQYEDLESIYEEFHAKGPATSLQARLPEQTMKSTASAH